MELSLNNGMHSNSVQGEVIVKPISNSWLAIQPFRMWKLSVEGLAEGRGHPHILMNNHYPINTKTYRGSSVSE